LVEEFYPLVVETELFEDVSRMIELLVLLDVRVPVLLPEVAALVISLPNSLGLSAILELTDPS
jgi:hypothetical protein